MGTTKGNRCSCAITDGASGTGMYLSGPEVVIAKEKQL
jgi:hypothetical protein